MWRKNITRSAYTTRQVQVSTPEVTCGCIAALCQWVYLKYMGTVTATHETSEHDTTHILTDVLLMYISTWFSVERLLCVLSFELKSESSLSPFCIIFINLCILLTNITDSLTEQNACQVKLIWHFASLKELG